MHGGATYYCCIDGRPALWTVLLFDLTTVAAAVRYVDRGGFEPLYLIDSNVSKEDCLLAGLTNVIVVNSYPASLFYYSKLCLLSPNADNCCKQ